MDFNFYIDHYHYEVGRTRSAACVRVNYEGVELDMYFHRGTDISMTYLVMDSKSFLTFDQFSEYCFSTLVAFGYITGKYPQDEGYFFTYANEEIGNSGETTMSQTPGTNGDPLSAARSSIQHAEQDATIKMSSLNNSNPTGPVPLAQVTTTTAINGPPGSNISIYITVNPNSSKNLLATANQLQGILKQNYQGANVNISVRQMTTTTFSVGDKLIPVDIQPGNITIVTQITQFEY